MGMARAVLACCVVAVLSGCAAAPAHKSLIYQARIAGGNERIDLRVLLVLDPALERSVFHTVYAWGVVPALPLGENLKRNLPLVARAAFREATVGSESDSVNEAGADAVLIARLVWAGDKGGIANWHDRTSTIVIEWTLKDLERHVIWADTATGAVKGRMGLRNRMNHLANERFRVALDGVYQKSYESLSSSPVIRDYANSIRK